MVQIFLVQEKLSLVMMILIKAGGEPTKRLETVWVTADELSPIPHRWRCRTSTWRTALSAAEERRWAPEHTHWETSAELKHWPLKPTDCSLTSEGNSMKHHLSGSSESLCYQYLSVYYLKGRAITAKIRGQNTQRDATVMWSPWKKAAKSHILCFEKQPLG